MEGSSAIDSKPLRVSVEVEEGSVMVLLLLLSKREDVEEEGEGTLCDELLRERRWMILSMIFMLLLEEWGRER